MKLRLGVNIDHVATLRNARAGAHPCPVVAAKLAVEAGADGITAHLREDRRHIRDDDMQRLKMEVNAPLNFEMAATEEMLGVALRVKPNACCLVPEKREELTTEGGLDVAGQAERLAPFITKLRQAGIRVSLFVDPSEAQITAAAAVGADIVEIHTGAYCHAAGEAQLMELEKIRYSVVQAHALGLECHAGHGLSYNTVSAIAALPEIVELNIGYFLIGQSVFEGLANAIRHMRRIMDEGRETKQ